ncbi:hypothetical protein KXD40_003550 [Peronospora effusa]|nr:hypothetical protein KXD40_003550 [Peronospora effusa]
MQEVVMKAKPYKMVWQRTEHSQEDATDKWVEGFADHRGLLKTDADDIASDDAGLRKSKKGKKRSKRDKIAAYRDAATKADLTDVYAVENRFAADAEEEKVDEDADDGYDDEELESECEKSVKILDIRIDDKVQMEDALKEEVEAESDNIMESDCKSREDCN